MVNKEEETIINSIIEYNNIVINEVYAKGYYSKDYKLFAIVWVGVFTDDEYRNFFDRVLDFAEQHTVKGVYSDVRSQGKVSPSSKDYFKNVVSPRGDAIGIGKAAVVVEKSTFKLFYINAIIKLSGRRAKIFVDQDEACNYLLAE